MLSFCITFLSILGSMLESFWGARGPLCSFFGTLVDFCPRFVLTLVLVCFEIPSAHPPPTSNLPRAGVRIGSCSDPRGGKQEGLTHPTRLLTLVGSADFIPGRDGGGPGGREKFRVVVARPGPGSARMPPESLATGAVTAARAGCRRLPQVKSCGRPSGSPPSTRAQLVEG